MTTESEDTEYSKFVPNKLQYKIVTTNDKDHYQRKSSSIASDVTDDRTIARRAIFHQIIATCAVLLLSAACGLPIGYSAILLPQLQNVNQNAATTNLTISGTTNTSLSINTTTTPTIDVADSKPEIAIDIEMGSWIASVHSLATPIGSLLSGPLADFIGRRNTLLLSVIPTFIGWCVLALAQSYPMLIVGRLTCGFATGILGGPAQVYIAETAEPNLRGLLIGAPFVSYSMGILIVYALGAAFHWRTVAWCGNILPMFAALAIFFIPESPVWLLRNKRQHKARKALTFLRGNEIIAQKELNDMSERFEKERAAMTNTQENIFKLCCQPVALKPLVIVIIFSLLQMFSGTFIVVFYAVDIISEFGANIDTKTAVISTAVVRMLCTMIFCAVLLFVRRRTIITLSSIGSGLSCLVLSVFLYMRLNEPKSSCDIYVAAVCLLAYIAFNTPLMVMPGIMIGELFPAKIRGRTAGGVFSAMNIGLFCLAKAFPLIQIKLKMRGVFMIFAVSSFLVSVFMFMFQPETKGRTLEQIEDYFKQSNWLWFRRDKTYNQVKHEAEKA